MSLFTDEDFITVAKEPIADEISPDGGWIKSGPWSEESVAYMRDVHMRILKDDVTVATEEDGHWYFSYRKSVIVCSHLRDATGLRHDCTADAVKASEQEDFVQKWLPAIMQGIEEIEHRMCNMCGRCKSHFVKWKNIGRGD